MPKKKLKRLTDWDWTTLVAAWRYYEYRSTIASATFPRDIFGRYFTGEYDPEECRRIAHQFYSVDHGGNGEADWQGKYLADCDIRPWTAFYAFCKAYCEGFAKVHTKDPSIHEAFCGSILEAFYCETLKCWIPRELYSGDGNVSIVPEYIVKIEEAGDAD
jgi:hypothetical protein